MSSGTRLQTVEVGIGMAGFFTFAFAALTFICEVMGEDALGLALTTLGFVTALILLVLVRRSIISQRDNAREPEGVERR